jgi:hypothetical protein
LGRWRVCRALPDEPGVPRALRFMATKRNKNGLHHVLDVSGDEDRRLKVRTPNSLAVLTLLDCLSVALFKHSRQARESYYDWREQHKARCDWLLQLLRTAPAKVKW